MLEFFLSALTIFLLRVVDISLYTVRLMMVVRGRKSLAFLFAFFQATMYVISMRMVFSDLGNWAKIAGYAAGFATGLILGMALENRLAVGYSHLRIISPKWGAAIIESLRQAGFAVTEIAGRGKEGMVSMLLCTVRRKRKSQAIQVILEVDPDAFITAQDVRTIRHGFW